MFRGLFHRLSGRRRYDGDAAMVRPDLSHRTEPTGVERLLRALRRKEEFGYDEREARFGDGVRHLLLFILLVAWLWFFLRSVMVINIFAG